MASPRHARQTLPPELVTSQESIAQRLFGMDADKDTLLKDEADESLGEFHGPKAWEALARQSDRMGTHAVDSAVVRDPSAPTSGSSSMLAA